MKKFTDPIVENSSIVFIEMDRSGRKVLTVNAAARKVFAQGPLFSDRAFSLKDHLAQVRLLKKSDGLASINTVKLGDVPYRFLYRLEGQRVIVEALDITDARHDWLTGLPNGGYFNEMLADAVERVRRQQDKGGKIAVFSMDLNGFKEVNDKYGHKTGNELLAEVAKRLQKITRGGDIVARPGGDEFAAIAYGIYKKEDAEKFARRINGVFRKPIPVGRKKFHTGISIGIMIGPKGEDNSSRMFEKADRAMYDSKRFHKPWCFHRDKV